MHQFKQREEAWGGEGELSSLRNEPQHRGHSFIFYGRVCTLIWHVIWFRLFRNQKKPAWYVVPAGHQGWQQKSAGTVCATSHSGGNGVAGASGLWEGRMGRCPPPTVPDWCVDKELRP